MQKVDKDKISRAACEFTLVAKKLNLTPTEFLLTLETLHEIVVDIFEERAARGRGGK